MAALWLCGCAAGTCADSFPSFDLFVQGPELSARDVVNAADYSRGAVTPGEIVVLFPSDAGPAAMAAWDLTNEGKQASPVGGTRVLFDGISASIVYSVRGQVAAIVPHEVAGRKETQVVVEYQGARSPEVTLPVIARAPALFTLDASGKGQAAMLNETGCCNSIRNPAPQGTVVSLYGTGDGESEPWGGPARTPRRVPITVTVGGMPAEILDVRNIGVLQVNFRVPASAPTGDAVPLVLAVGESRSSAAVTMAVRSSHRRVMVASPDQAMGEWLSEILQDGGREVLVARESRQAVALAQAHPVDLVICDLAIPGEDSLEMIRAIRAQRPKVKLLALSGSLSAEALRAADMLGVQAVLRIPLAAAQVRSRVETLLQERPARY